MKRQIILLSLCFACMTVWAQKGVRVGGFFLPQYVTMRNADDLARQQVNDFDFRYEPLWGMSGGAMLAFGGGENFSVRTGLLYSQQGYRYSFKRDFLERYSATTRLEYLKVPLMLEIRSNYTHRKSQFSFAAGYQFGFLTNAYTYDNIREYVAPLPSNITRYPSVYDTYNRYNGSAVIETGFDFALTRRFSAMLHLRADYSLLNAENKNATYRITDQGYTRDEYYWDLDRANTHNITAGLLFGVSYNLNPAEK